MRNTGFVLGLLLVGTAACADNGHVVADRDLGSAATSGTVGQDRIASVPTGGARGERDETGGTGDAGAYPTGGQGDDGTGGRGDGGAPATGGRGDGGFTGGSATGGIVDGGVPATGGQGQGGAPATGGTGTGGASTGGSGGNTTSGGSGGASGEGETGGTEQSGGSAGSGGSGGIGGLGGSPNLLCTVTEDQCACLAGPSVRGNAESCGTDWSCCIYTLLATSAVDWVCDCVSASQTECDQLLSEAFPRAEIVATCPPP